VLEKWLELKNEKLAKTGGKKSYYACKIVALFNLSSLEDIDMKNKINLLDYYSSELTMA